MLRKKMIFLSKNLLFYSKSYGLIDPLSYTEKKVHSQIHEEGASKMATLKTHRRDMVEKFLSNRSHWELDGWCCSTIMAKAIENVEFGRYCGQA